MSKAERTVNLVGVLITALSFALYLHHETKYGGITMWVVGVTLLFVVGWGITGWAVWRNLRDAHRAEKLEARIQSESSDVISLTGKQKSAGAQAALLSHFASQARDLLNILEGAWHHWNVAGEVLTHPAGGKYEMKNWSAALAYERRDFIVLYSNHLMWVRTEVPVFASAAVQNGCPSDAEYSDVLANLRQHVQLLEQAALSVWKSAQKLV